MENSDRFPALNYQGAMLAHQIDGETTAARRLAADRAVAKLVRLGRMALHREMHGATAAGTFKQFRHLP
jgi:hypothetical protein